MPSGTTTASALSDRTTGDHSAEQVADDLIASMLPIGLRDGVTVLGVRLARRDAHLSPAGQTMAHALRNAAAGIPRDAEQDARWRKLGIHPGQTGAA